MIQREERDFLPFKFPTFTVNRQFSGVVRLLDIQINLPGATRENIFFAVGPDEAILESNLPLIFHSLNLKSHGKSISKCDENAPIKGCY